MPSVNLFQSLANLYGYAAAAYGWGEVKETKGGNSEEFSEGVRGNELVPMSKSAVQASPDTPAATDGPTTILNDVPPSHSPSPNACQQPVSTDDEAVNFAGVSQQPVATVNDAPLLRPDHDLGPETEPAGEIDETVKSERGLGTGDVAQYGSTENVDRNVSDTETSTTDPSSNDSASFVSTSVESVTSVESMEGQSLEIKAGVDVAVNDVDGLVKGKDIKGEVVEVDSRAASVEPAFAFKSWAEEMAEYQAEKKRALEAWEIENALLMDTVNKGTSAWYNSMRNAEQREETSFNSTAAMSIQPVKDFRDEIADLNRVLNASRPKKRADWGPKRDAFLPLGDKPQSSSQSRNVTEYLQTAEEVVSVTTTETRRHGSLAGDGQLPVEGFARPPRMRRGRGRQAM